MKHMKKLVALLISVIMLMSMAVTSFAAEGQTGTLTVTIPESNKKVESEQTISIYKLFDLTVAGTNYGYKVNPTFKENIKNALGAAGANLSTDEQFYEAIQALKEDSGATTVQAFANRFTETVLNLRKDDNDVWELKFTNADREKTIENLPYGYYLLHQKGVQTIQSSLVTVDEATGCTVSLKGEAPSINKTSDVTSAEIGKTISYTITGTIPDITGYTEYIYKIKDTLSKGLDFVDQNGVAPTGTEYKVEIEITDGIDQMQPTPKATLGDSNKKTMTLNLTEWIKSNQADNKGKDFTVKYYAKVNANADTTEDNSAQLEYGNDPEQLLHTVPDVVKTPTFPLDINKVEKGTDTKLAGATFRIYKNKENADAADDNAIKVTQVTDIPGKYTVAVDEAKQNMDMISVGSTVDTGKGNLYLNGLAEGTYYLVETNAPEGYVKLPAPLKIVITRTDTEATPNVEFEIKVGENGAPVEYNLVRVENSTGTILPPTGGINTIIFTIIAIILIVGVVISFVRSRRK